MNRTGDAVEPGIERPDDGRRRIALRQRGEAAQIGKQQCRLDGLADIAPQGTCEHPRGAAPAKIGLQSRRQRGARGKGGERRRREARGLAEPVYFTRVNGRGPIQPSKGPSGLDPTTSSWTMPQRGFQRASAGPLRPARVPLPPPRALPATNPNASITSPLSARHSQVRRAISGCGTASVSAPPASGTPSATRSRADLRQQQVGARRLAGRIDEP